MDNQRLDSLLRFLSEPGRRELAALLAEAPLTVGEISEVLQLPQSTVSRHLKNLRATGLLFDHREGSRTINRLVEPASNGRSDLPDLLNQWIRRQSLPRALRTRLDLVLRKRNGEPDSFARLAHQWDELRCRYFGTQFHLEALTALLPSSLRVLDVGTGTGYLLPTLAHSFREVVAVDPSGAMLKLAQERAIREGLQNIRFRYGRLESLPLESESVDLAIAILVLHHSSERLPDSLAELHRVLSRKGTVLIVDVSPHEMEDFQHEMGDPVRGLEPDDIARIMNGVGFEELHRRNLPVAQPGLPGGPEEPAPDLFLIKALKP